MEHNIVLQELGIIKHRLVFLFYGYMFLLYRLFMVHTDRLLHIIMSIVIIKLVDFHLFTLPLNSNSQPSRSTINLQLQLLLQILHIVLLHRYHHPLTLHPQYVILSYSAHIVYLIAAFPSPFFLLFEQFY